MSVHEGYTTRWCLTVSLEPPSTFFRAHSSPSSSARWICTSCRELAIHLQPTLQETYSVLRPRIVLPLFQREDVLDPKELAGLFFRELHTIEHANSLSETTQQVLVFLDSPSRHSILVRNLGLMSFIYLTLINIFLESAFADKAKDFNVALLAEPVGAIHGLHVVCRICNFLQLLSQDNQQAGLLQLGSAK